MQYTVPIFPETLVLEVSGKMGTVYCILLCCGLFHLKEIKWPPFFLTLLT